MSTASSTRTAPPGLEGHKGRLAEETNPDKLTGGLAEAIRDADIFIGTSIAGALTPELAATMAKDAIVFAMANPTPEIMPDLAKQAGVRVIGTGRSDFPNQVNNVLAFPGIFKGALSVRARGHQPRYEDGRRQGHRGSHPRRRAERGKHPAQGI